MAAAFVGDRVFAAPVTAEGDTLSLLTDTGGGANMLSPATVDRLRLAVERRAVDGDTMTMVSLPPFRVDASIPKPGAVPPFGETLLVMAPQMDDGNLGRDGLLGRTWHADRVWLFDYPARRLYLAPGGVPFERSGAGVIPLGFQADSAGERTTHFPRIRIEVDGDSLDLLLDTGASLALSPAALTALADGGPAVRGTSFIAEQVFQRWRARHPDWRVIEHADRFLDMPVIEVPTVSVAGQRVGPVWFTMRRDANFHDFMSQWMDRRVDGALGGSALRFFRVTVDYPRALARFERRAAPSR